MTIDRIEIINAKLAVLKEIEREIFHGEESEAYSWATRANFAQIVQRASALLESQRRRLVRALTSPDAGYPG